MKLLVVVIFFLFGFSDISAQSEKLFSIEHKTLTTYYNEDIKNEFKSRSPYFFEDENYIVRKTCQGEWGGSIIFKNKKTQIEYACRATCAVTVNKIDGKYIISNTLPHMDGSANVIEIDNPESMTVLADPKPRKQFPLPEGGSLSSQGSKLVADTFNMLILGSFQYEGEVYHITTDLHKTYVSKIENSRFVHLDVISNEMLWTLDQDRIMTADDHYIAFFRNKDGTKGYLDITGNKISVIRFWV